MADVDHGERVLLDNFKAAGPVRIAQAGSCGGLDPVESFARVRALQPEQKQGDRNGCVVELKHAKQSDFKEAKIIISELEIEPLP
jgi:hypothetical protein